MRATRAAKLAVAAVSLGFRPARLLPLHEPARVVAQVQLVAVLGRDAEPELPLLSRDRDGERLTSDVTVAIEEASLGTVLLDTVALEVSEVLASRVGSSRPHWT